MNNYKHHLFIVALFLLASCSEKINDEATNSDSKVKQVTFIASLQNDGKTVLSDEKFGDIEWCAMDSIGIFTPGSASADKFITEEGGPIAEFKGQTKESDIYYGVYPFNANAVMQTEGLIRTFLPYSQSLYPGTFAPNSFISAGISDSNKIAFYNILGGIRFTVESNQINRVVLKGNDSEKIAGDVSISFSSEAASIQAAPGTDAVDYVELVSETALVPDSFYYIIVIPQQFERGITMEFFNGQTSIAKTSVDALINIKKSSFSTIRSADNSERMSSISNGHDLSESGSANCYIVSKPGNYKFPSVAGNSDTKLSKATSAIVLWESVNSGIAPQQGSLIERAYFKNNYIYFSTPRTLRSGNAVIAVKDKYDTILWSWHIWICSDYDPAISSQSYPGKSYVVMDRNIGALSSDSSDPLSCGLFYQWGRKDPFPGSISFQDNKFMATTYNFTSAVTSSKVGTIDYSLANPGCFITGDGQTTTPDWLAVKNNTLWNATTKTMYDPCPPGWIVPADEASGSSLWNGVDFEAADKGFVIPLSSGSKSWYPCNGQILSNNFVIQGAGEYACYWSSSAGKALKLDLTQTTLSSQVIPVYSGCGRAEGHSIRCVAK